MYLLGVNAHWWMSRMNSACKGGDSLKIHVLRSVDVMQLLQTVTLINSAATVLVTVSSCCRLSGTVTSTIKIVSCPSYFLLMTGLFISVSSSVQVSLMPHFLACTASCPSFSSITFCTALENNFCRRRRVWMIVHGVIPQSSGSELSAEDLNAVRLLACTFGLTSSHQQALVAGASLLNMVNAVPYLTM
jgi:hypothetical protein